MPANHTQFPQDNGHIYSSKWTSKGFNSLKKKTNYANGYQERVFSSCLGWGQDHLVASATFWS